MAFKYTEINQREVKTKKEGTLFVMIKKKKKAGAMQQICRTLFNSQKPSAIIAPPNRSNKQL